MYKDCICFLVDDDVDDRFIFKEALEHINESIIFVSAYDGTDALDQLNSNNFTTPDIIFLDLNMPRLNGKELLVAIKKMKGYQNVPVIVYSTSSSPVDINKCMELGADGYMIKHNSFKQLCNDLKEVLSGHLK
jgi:CheY-like chemotaxis protein